MNKSFLNITVALAALAVLSLEPASAQSLESSVQLNAQSFEETLDNSSSTNNSAAEVLSSDGLTITRFSPASGIPVAANAGYAASQYGVNHAYVSSLGPIANFTPYPQIIATSDFTDTFNLTPIGSVGSLLQNADVVFDVTLNGTVSTVATYSGFSNWQYLVESTTNNDAIFHQPIVDEIGSGSFSATNQTLVSDPFELVNGHFTGTFELDAGARGGLADFADTAVLSGITVIGAGGNVIPTVDYQVTSASGGSYLFTSNHVSPVPESSSVISFGAMILLGCCVLWFKQRREVSVVI